MTEERDEDDTTSVGERLMARIPPDRRLGLAVGLALSLAWLALVGTYLAVETGWENLRWMLPHELALVLAGASSPLVALWLVVHYVTRGADLRFAARSLQRELEKLTYPDEAAETRVIAAGVAAARRAADGWGADRIAHLESRRGRDIFVWDTAWDSESDAVTFFTRARAGLRGTVRATGSRIAIGARPDRSVDLLLRRDRRVPLVRDIGAGALGEIRRALLDALSR